MEPETTFSEDSIFGLHLAPKFWQKCVLSPPNLTIIPTTSLYPMPSLAAELPEGGAPPDPSEPFDDAMAKCKMWGAVALTDTTVMSPPQPPLTTMTDRKTTTGRGGRRGGGGG